MAYTELRFKIVEERSEGILRYKLLDNHTGEYVSVLPEYGGAINGMALQHNGELVEIMSGYSSENELKEILNSSFRGSNLFPFPNRIQDAKYTFQNEVHELNMNFPHENNAIHGLVFDKAFKVVDAEDGEIACILILEFNSKPMPGYPFTYLFKVIYRLNEGSGFDCMVKISNNMDQSIPVAHGWHPYFMAGIKQVNGISLEFPADVMLDVDDRNIPTGKEEKYSEFNTLKQIGETQLDNCFRLMPGNNIASTILKDEQSGFGYRIWQETGKYKYNYLQIYTPPDRKSIAIEPMTSAPNAFNNEKGLIVLAPFESIDASWGISHLS
ncbi:MAG: hypothetical protein JW801_09965 [Bacteroidales bacterium]|nr:hypothetical protein [Bacteroidales bacterium]